MNVTPAVALSGDPGTDQQTLTSAGYLGGVIVALTSNVASGYTGNGTPIGTGGYTQQSANEPAFGAIGNIVPCDTLTSNTTGNIPFATLLNGPGEFAGAIGPSGSKKAPVVRALWQGNVDNQGYDSGASTFAVGQYVYCGSSGSSAGAVGKYTVVTRSGGGTASTAIPVGICTHVPTAGEPWLGVASLI